MSRLHCIPCQPQPEVHGFCNIFMDVFEVSAPVCDYV